MRGRLRRCSVSDNVRQMTQPLLEDDSAELVAAAQAGDRAALTALLERHRPWIYNIAHKMVWNAAIAEDVTQEILIKILHKLGSFEGRSSFRTWVYRIVANHVLNLQRSRHEEAVGSFADFGRVLDAAPVRPLPDLPQPQRDLLVEEAKVSCLSGMLLCLSREQRIAYLLGNVFELPDAVAAEILEVTPEAFRKRLSRARADLHEFMHDKCGLVRSENPCRCAHKTTHFIRMGAVNPDNLQFHRNYQQRIREVATAEASSVYDAATAIYPSLFRDHPFSDPPAVMAMVRKSVQGTELARLFDDEPQS